MPEYEAIKLEWKEEDIGGVPGITPVVLCLDASGSMTHIDIDGKTRIAKLNEALREFYEKIAKDPDKRQHMDLAIIAFQGEEAKFLHAFTRLFDEQGNFIGKQVKIDRAWGKTPMGDALEKALELCELRKEYYKESEISNFCQPCIILLSDGKPTDEEKVRKISKRMQEEIRKDGIVHYSFFTYPINDEAEIALKELFPFTKEGKKDLAGFVRFIENSVNQAERENRQKQLEDGREQAQLNYQSNGDIQD